MSNPIQEEMDRRQKLAEQADAEERRLESPEDEETIGDEWTEHVRALYRADEHCVIVERHGHTPWGAKT